MISSFPQRLCPARTPSRPRSKSVAARPGIVALACAGLLACGSRSSLDLVGPTALSLGPDGGISANSTGSSGGGSSDSSSGSSGGAGTASGCDPASSPPSCAPGGPGMTDCGATHDCCCTSLEVTGGTFYRTYGNTGDTPATADDFADPRR